MMLPWLRRARRSRPTTEIPRIIYSLWLQGIEQAPELVKLNFARWAEMNPGYQFKALDEADVDALLASDPAPIYPATPQALSDVVRAKLLRHTGGVWVDATVFPTRPLDHWLPQITAQSGFFAFERPGPDRPLSSWFIAASADNMMVDRWAAEVEAYWRSPRSAWDGIIPENPVGSVTEWTDQFPYFWFHYLFQKLVDTDADFAAGWARCAKLSADEPHLMQARMGQQPLPEWGEVLEIADRAPMHKLNWRAEYPLETLRALPL